eukprot:gene7809-8656_t
MACSSQPYACPDIMVFRPTMQEFQDFPAYIKKMEDCGAHNFGVAKVIPPKEWFASRHYDMEKIGQMVIDAPIAQLVTGQQGLYQQFNIQQKPLTVKELKDLAESDKYRPPEEDFDKLERAYWKNITFNPAIYGADVAGSIYDKDVKFWNINHLNTILDLIESETKVKILGVNTAYLYFGMWKTSFAWHTEDMDLYSINYLHFGAPKSWYAIPPEHGKRLETLAAGFFPGSAQTCSQFLRHKMTVISPLMLKKYSIPFYKITQYPGEFMITFPYGYHAGFNQGFNCAESTNFASLRWIDYGKKAKPCVCKSDNVNIEMEIFVKKYQPSQYKEYMESKEKKRASSTVELADEEKKANKKQKKKIPMKRYPRISAVKSIVKQVRKETSEGKLPADYKKQRQRAIEKAKDLIKKAESAGRKDKLAKGESSDKVGKQATKLSRKAATNTATGKRNAAVGASTATVSSAPQKGGEPMSFPRGVEQDKEKRTQRELKLLEIKEEMEREMEEKMNKRKNVKISRARRHEARQVKQKLRTKPASSTTINSPGRSRNSSETTVTIISKAKPVSDAEQQRKTHQAHLKVKGWTAALNGLWIDQVPDFQREQAYNKCLSRSGHGCAVCAYFDQDLAVKMREFKCDTSNTDEQPQQQEVITSSSSSSGSSSSAQFSTPFVPVICFMQDGEQSSALPNLSNKESKLHTCAKCHVTVHEHCYGIGEQALIEDTGDNVWFCDPCRTATDLQSRSQVRCEICPIRGGALKRTTNDGWAHIVCAMAFQDVSFTDPKQRSLIDLGSLNSARTKLRCVYCRRSSSEGVNNGACVQCIAGKCAHSFHITCGFQNGIPLYSGDWPMPLEFMCRQHAKTRFNRGRKRAKAQVNEQDIVFAKHKNGRFYKARVESIESTIFYYVVFEDGSFCHDLPPEDILNYQPGVIYSDEEKVDVLWTDGIVYPSVVKSHETILKYEVVFEDGSTLLLKRNDVYKEDEELPRKIQTKLSTATETANLLWKASSIRESPTKRARMDSKQLAKLLS